MAGEHGGMAEILGDHGFAHTVGADQDEIACARHEIERERALDGLPFYALGPTPLKVGHGFELFQSAAAQAAFETAAGALAGFGVDELFEKLKRTPASPGGESEKIVEWGRQGAQPERFESRGQISLQRDGMSLFLRHWIHRLEQVA